MESILLTVFPLDALYSSVHAIDLAFTSALANDDVSPSMPTTTPTSMAPEIVKMGLIV
jgi:hypothetical protein